MKPIFLLLIIDVFLIIAINLFYLELGNKFDFWFMFWTSFFFSMPFAIYGVIKLILNIAKGKKMIGKTSDDEIVYKFAKYMLKRHNLDVWSPNRIFGDHGPRNSNYRYTIKVHRNYPSEIEKWCVEIGELIVDSHVFNGLETKVILFFDTAGNIDSDETMNNQFGWKDEILANIGQYYLIPPSKTEKAEKLLEKIYKEKGEIPEELVSEAIREELKAKG